MLDRLGIRGSIMALLTVVSSLLALLTLAVPRWIELIFQVTPDGGSGALEVGVLVTFVLAAVAFGTGARRAARTRLATQI